VNKEEALFPTWILALFTVIIIVILIALFPGKKLLNDLNKNPKDRAAVEYLKTLIDKNPTKGALKIRLANAQIELGKKNEAKKTLTQLLTYDEFKNKAQFLLIQIEFQEYFELDEIKLKSLKKKHVLLAVKKLYKQETEIKKLDLLAQWSQELANPALSAKIYAQIIKILEHKAEAKTDKNQSLWLLFGINSAYADETKNVEYYVQKYLQSLLAANQPELALEKADLYINKYKQSKPILKLAIKIAGYANAPELSRNWGRLAVEQFAWNEVAIQQQISREQAANKSKNSLQWAVSFLKKHPNSTELLAYTANLASTLGENQLSKLLNLQLARSLNLQLLAKNPDDSAIIAKVIQNELALKDLKAALHYAQLRVELQANSIKAHQQLADIALWSGNPLLSLQQRVWLYQHTGDEVQAIAAIKLGKAIFQYDTVADIYGRMGHTRVLTNTELTDFYQILQATGFVDAGAKNLKSYLTKHPNHQQAWLYLAKTEALTGNFKQAVNTLAKFEKRFGKSVSLSLLQAQMRLKTDNFPQAWEMLAHTGNSTTPSNNKFWQFYTQVAWLTGHETEAAKGYQIQLTQGKIERGMVSRLLQLSSKKQDKQQQLELLILAWNKFKQANNLLDAIDLSQKLKQAQQTARLITIADANTKLFHKNIRYWIIKASLASQENKQNLAKTYLLKALALDNQSVNTRLSLLWHLIDYGSDTDLRAFLASNTQIATNQAALWEVFAIAYHRLGEPARALPWYRRSVQHKPHNYLLLLNYAEALTETGERAKAIKIQRFIVTQVRPQLVAKLAQNKTDIAEFKRSYATVILEQFGIDISDRWFKYAEQQNQHPSVLEQAIFDEYRITWMLAKGRMQPARYYVLKALHQRVNLAAWQQMAVAIYDNDLVAVEKILKHPSQLLPTDRVVGLRTIGKEQMALVKARRYLNEVQREDELRILRRQAADLGVRNPNGFAMTWQSRNISELDLWGIKSTAAITRTNNSFWISHKYTGLASSTRNLLVQANQTTENQLTFKWQHRTLRDESWIQGYANLRADQDLYGITIGNIHSLWQGWSITTEWAYNELAEDSAAFRLVGARDRISLGLNGEISKREYFAINLHGRHYKSRSDSHLGLGYGVGFLVGHWIKYAQPAININLYGNFSASDLVSMLPTEVQAVIGTSRDISSVLTKDYKEIGLNLRIQEGEFRPFGFIERYFHYYIDTGLFFNSSPALSGIGGTITAGMGGRLFTNDDLSINVRYSSVQGGINTLPTKAVELRYSFRFD